MKVLMKKMREVRRMPLITDNEKVYKKLKKMLKKTGKECIKCDEDISV